MQRTTTLFTALLLLALAATPSGIRAQSTNAAPYCQYNDGLPVKGISGAISKVSVGTLSNTTAFGNLPSAYTSTNCTQLYTYYNNVAAPTLTAGNGYTIDLEFKSWYDGEPRWYAAYIDYNHNNLFDTTDEMIIDMAHANVRGLLPASNTNVIITTNRSNTFTVPAGAMTGITRMRVIRSHKDYQWRDSVSRVNPCKGFPDVITTNSKWYFGEVEDYDVMIAAPSSNIPTVVSIGSNAVTRNSAMLTGVVNANGATATLMFEYGPTISYGMNAISTPALATGTSNTTASAALSGLQANTTYHYRFKATAGSNTYYSADGSFTTQAATAVNRVNVNDALLVFPNPSDGRCYLSVPGKAGSVEVQVVSMTGQIVFSSALPLTGGQVSMDLRKVPAGMYEVRASLGGSVFRSRITLIN